MDLRDFGTVHTFVGCSVSTKASLAREVKRCSKSTLRRLIITARTPSTGLRPRSPRTIGIYTWHPRLKCPPLAKGG